MNTLSNFIENVSSSNLETFHSKAIVWLLNTIKDSNHKIFTRIIKNSNIPEGAQHIKSIAEFKSHDIISLFKAGDKYHLVFWENKIKADFHFKRVDISKPKKTEDKDYSEKLKRSEEYQNAINRGFSQPYYYQVRHHLNLALKGSTWLEQFSKNLGIDKKIREEQIDYHWIIISPHNEDELEKFHYGTWYGYKLNKECEYLSKGDKGFIEDLNFNKYTCWKFITYQKLFENAYQNLEQTQQAYVQYIKSEKYFRVTSNNNSWSVDSLLNLHDKLRKNHDYIYKWNITGSAKAPNPLLNICFSLDKFIGNQAHSTLPEFQKILNYNKIAGFKSQKTEADRITCNVQLQGKAIKVQYSHWDYDNVKLSGKDANRGLDYAKAMFSFLAPGMIINDRLSLEGAFTNWIELDKLLPIDAIKINLPKTKTGLSFSIACNEENKFIIVEWLCQTIESLTKST